MLDRPITAARATRDIVEVIVSTDDDEIAAMATALGASVLGRRPDHLATDQTPTAPVVEYEVRKYSEVNGLPDFLIVLYPTSVFITSADLDTMVSRLGQQNEPVQMVMTVAAYPAPIERAWSITKNDIGVIADPANRNVQSQDFRERFFDVGQAYVSKIHTWGEIQQGRDVATALHILPMWRAWDINSQDDFRIAELLLYGLGGLGSSKR